MNDDRMDHRRGSIVVSFPTTALELPGWVEDLDREYPTLEECMRLAVELARLNVEREGRGPFGAAGLEQETGGLPACGMNLVVPASCSVAHAEMVAIMVVPRAVGFDEGAKPPDRAAALEERGILSRGTCCLTHTHLLLMRWLR